MGGWFAAWRTGGSPARSIHWPRLGYLSSHSLCRLISFLFASHCGAQTLGILVRRWRNNAGRRSTPGWAGAASSGSTQWCSHAYCTMRPAWFGLSWFCSLISDLNQLHLFLFKQWVCSTWPFGYARLLKRHLSYFHTSDHYPSDHAFNFLLLLFGQVVSRFGYQLLYTFNTILCYILHLYFIWYFWCSHSQMHTNTIAWHFYVAVSGAFFIPSPIGMIFIDILLHITVQDRLIPKYRLIWLIFCFLYS